MTKSKVFLRSLRIEGFRSCKRTVFDMNQHLSVLIGPNGAGKTNALQAITLLGAWMNRRPISRRTSEAAVSQCRILAEFQVGRKVLSLRSTLSYTLDEENREDVIGSQDEWRIGKIDDKENTSNAWMLMPPELYIPQHSYHDDLYLSRRARMLRHPTNRFLLKSYKSIPKSLIIGAQKIFEFRNRISYYSASQFTNPGRCPSSIEIDEEIDLIRPRPSRYEHQRFMLDLYRLRETKPEKYSSYLALVGRDGLKLISTIYWKKVKVASSQVEVRTGGKIVKRSRYRLLIVPSVQCGLDRLSFSQLSEGTFKTLALIFYLLTDDSDLLLIEEPEVCVHHGLLASIVELIKSQSTEKQIIFSTHSDFVLDQVEPDQVFSAISRERRGTIIRSLSKGYPKQAVEALRDFLRTSGNLGEFWRQGGFDL